MNAAISAEGHDLEEKRRLVFEDLKADGLLKAIEAIHELPGISEALDTQLDIFEEAYDIDMSSIVPKKTPEELFKILRDMMRQTTVYEDFGRVLLHLQNVRRNGQPGKISWDLIDSFVQITAQSLAKEGPSKSDAVRDICAQLVSQIDPSGAPIAIAGVAGAPPPPPGGPEGAAVVGEGAPPPPPPPGGGPPPPPPPGGGGPPPPPPPGGGPPPPPPPGGGGPPPPPPPGGGGPPPPPGMGGPPPPALPKKKKIVPGHKMRNFNWNMINVRKIKDTVWEELDDEHVKLDIPAIEDAFALREKVKSEEDGSMTDRAARKVLIQVLDSKRSQNVSIMLSRFGQVSFEEIKKAIINLDTKVIDLDNLQAMIPFMPMPEEIEQLKEHEHTPITEFGKAEGFFLTVMNIPLLTLKLKAWDFMRSFDVRFGALEESVTILETARRETRNSKKLKTIMEFVLAVGNYMNGSTSRGECFGFKLDSLNKMLDVKSSADPKVTLMHFVQSQAEAKFRDSADLISDFTQLETAPRQNVPTLQGDLGRLKGELNIVVNLAKNPNLEEGKIKQAVLAFVPMAETSVEKLVGRMETVVTHMKELLVYFGEDPKVEPDEFFGQVATFVLAFDKAKKDTARRKALAEKTALAEAKKAKAAEERRAKKAAGGSQGAQDNDAFEDMLSDLGTGAAFSRMAANARKAREAGDAPMPGQTGFKLPAFTLRKVSRPESTSPQESPTSPSNGTAAQLPALKPVVPGASKTAPAKAGSNSSSDGAQPEWAKLRKSSIDESTKKDAVSTSSPPDSGRKEEGQKVKPPIPPKPKSKSSLPTIPEVKDAKPTSSNAESAPSPKSARKDDEQNGSTSPKTTPKSGRKEKKKAEEPPPEPAPSTKIKDKKAAKKEKEKKEKAAKEEKKKKK